MVLESLFEMQVEIEFLLRERLREPLLDLRHFLFVRDRLEPRVADAKDIEDEIVAAGEDVGAENIQAGAREGTGDARQQLAAIPSANPDFGVALVRARNPADRRRQRVHLAGESRVEELVKEPDVLGDVRGLGVLEIPLRHVFKVRIDFVAQFAGDFPAHRHAQALALNRALAVESLAIGEVERGAAVELPDERFLPVAPVLVAGALSVRQREEHEHVEVGLAFDLRGELRNGRRVVEVPPLRGHRQGDVNVHEQHERFALLGSELEPARDALRIDGARLGVQARIRGLARVVQEEREVEDEGVFELLKNPLILRELGLGGVDHPVELLDANERVFVRRVSMEKLVLHEARELSELRHVAPEKIHFVHRAQNRADLALPRHDRVEGLSRRL